MANIIMKGGQMVVETDDDKEREHLSKLAYASAKVEIDEPKKAAKPKPAKKGDDE